MGDKEPWTQDGLLSWLLAYLLFPDSRNEGGNKAGEPGQTSCGDPARLPLSLISPQSYLDIADAAQVMLE